MNVAVLLCAFSNDIEEQMPVKQVTNWTVFGEIQTATTTFIACLTRFRSISRPFEKLHRISTGPCGFITVPIPIPCPYPWEFPIPHGSPDFIRHDISHLQCTHVRRSIRNLIVD